MYEFCKRLVLSFISALILFFVGSIIVSVLINMF